MNEQTCHFCGCVFEVNAPYLEGHMESEEYYCPICREEYRTRASNTPSTRVIKDRTDGRRITVYEFAKIQKQISELEESIKDKRQK